MRVVIVAPPYYEIPPVAYGGTELICYLLAEGMVDRGHDVTVIGAGARRTRARFAATFPQAQPEESPSAASIEARHYALAAAVIRETSPDVVHVHTTALPDLPASVPAVLTVHSAVSGPDATGANLELLSERAHLVAISRAQAASAPRARWAAVVPNGIDLGRYPADGTHSDLAVTLGRISPYKGTHLAIDAAVASGRRLVIAGAATTPREQAYFEAEIRPRLGPDVTWAGELGFDRKVDLLGQAACLVFPALWQEPFGLVLVEAMACGTPVAGFRTGAVPELVVHGETGVLCQEPAGLPAAINQAARLDPARCRAHVARNFSSARMVADYERLYRSLAGLS
jgi:glycosyltransferase involved in cell wall biosynthesis